MMLNKEMKLICSEAASRCLVLSHAHLCSAAGDGEQRHRPNLPWCTSCVPCLGLDLSSTVGNGKQRDGPNLQWYSSPVPCLSLDLSSAVGDGK